MAVAQAFAVALVVASLHAEAVWLDVPQSGTKCMSKEIQSNVVVLADYSIMFESHPYSHPTIAVKVTSPYENTLHHSENATVGQFAFTTAEAGNYLACFWIDSAEKGSGVSVNLDWKIGIATKDWDAIAKKEKIEGVELELWKLEVAVQAIHQNLIYLKEREAEMRTVSEATNARVVWFSTLALWVCIAVSVLQVWHLQGFFRKKKLI
ncbi:transmembrane emp24 domain-containing protein p24delta3-like [Miscanthus floridulus]|uniref:transmembrane emp24 domain-containing protein p24delta3-like n=1 Tax=Miscanthus floridulus TaxID=154761 RepID=UPI003458BF7C